MKKEGKSLQSSPKDDHENVAAVPVNGGKELIEMFNSMSVTKTAKSSDSFTSYKRSERRRRHNAGVTEAEKNWSSLRQQIHSKFKRRTRERRRQRAQVSLKPSKLTHVLDEMKASDQIGEESASRLKSAEARFSDFSAACSKELETIERDTSVRPKKKNSKCTGSSVSDDQERSKRSRAHKRRKSSASCAQQARNECYNPDVNLSIDILADYLDEAILLPKKMSYMAELMYT
jgi:hypothetical protein